MSGKKSVYSLVLSDDVVAAIDRMAYSKGVSRSAMIDSLLAKEVSYITPEMRIKQMFERMESGLASDVFLPTQSSTTSYTMRSALSYKYNPSLRYSVELLREYLPSGEFGKLRVWLRSRSEGLTVMLINFFKIWEQAEREFNGSVQYYLEDGRIVRVLRLCEPSVSEITHTSLGDEIARYVSTLNDAIEAYFTRLDDPKGASRAVWRVCAAYYNTARIKL